MQRQLQKFLDQLEVAGSSRQLCDALAQVIARMDLNAFAYIAIPSTAGRQPRLITNYSEKWRTHYVERRYETCDPIVLHSLRRASPFGWGPNFDCGNSFARMFFREAADFGIRYGYTIPIHHWHGRFAALTFAVDRQCEVFQRTTQLHTLALQLIAFQFHWHVREKLEPLITLAGIHLTCRERQCLALAAQGKTFPDIALILDISPRTVKDYIDNAKVKFGVRSVRDAVVCFQVLKNAR